MKIGIIGGSGLEKLKMKDVVVISRHGEDHSIPPHKVDYKGNIEYLKKQGCDCIIATTAVGSLRQNIERGDIIILDQFFDFTKRQTTIFEDKVERIPMAEPFDEKLRDLIMDGCDKLKLRYHPVGIVVTIEGPRFNTRAESKTFRMWGMDVVNMTTSSEAIIANEMKIPYASIAVSTDYDSWKEDTVSWEEIQKVLKENSEKIEKLLKWIINKIK